MFVTSESRDLNFDLRGHINTLLQLFARFFQFSNALLTLRKVAILEVLTMLLPYYHLFTLTMTTGI